LPSIRFIVVYILEAHASDTWPMKWAVEWPRPRTLGERVDYALECRRALGVTGTMDLLVDDMNNAFDHAFRAWPTAYYLLNGTTLSYIGDCEMDSASYNISKLIGQLNLLLN